MPSENGPQKTLPPQNRKNGLFVNWKYLLIFFRLLRAYKRKEYAAVPWLSIIFSAIAAAYFLFPLDFIFDLVPLIGYVDDALVFAIALAQIKTDLDKFADWESKQQKPL